MSSAFVLTVSTLIGPSTIAKISSSTWSKSRPDLAMWVGFVVTPSRMPQLQAVLISLTFAVSINSCMKELLDRRLSGVVTYHIPAPGAGISLEKLRWLQQLRLIRFL